MRDKTACRVAWLLALLTPLALVAVGWQIFTAPDRAEADRRNLALAISILCRLPEATGAEVRSWAVETLGRLSDEPPGEEVQRGLMGAPVPALRPGSTRESDRPGCRESPTASPGNGRDGHAMPAPAGPTLSYQKVWGKTPEGEVVARGLELLEVCQVSENASLTSQLLFEPIAGHRVVLTHTILAPTGTSIWRVDDARTGWWADLRIEYGWKATGLKDFFNQAHDHCLIPGASLWVTFRAAGEVEQSAVVRAEDQRLSEILIPLRKKLATGPEGQALRTGIPPGLVATCELLLQGYSPGLPGEGFRSFPEFLLSTLGKKSRKHCQKTGVAVLGGPRILACTIHEAP